MEKLVRSPRAVRGAEEGASTTRVRRSSSKLDRANRTFVCSVLVLDIVEYSKKPVSEQLKIKEQFNARISEAIQAIAVDDRIILDTGDGVAVSFLGDPEDALLVAMNLSDGFASGPEREPRVEVRIGTNLGPVRLVRDTNGQPNIIGDGINVAQRVMSFARPGQVLVSRAYYETVSRVSEDYAQLFAYQGSRTDKHVREHEIYEIAAPGSALDLARRRHQARPARRPILPNLAASTEPAASTLRRKWLGNRALAYGAAALSVTALIAAAVSFVGEPRDKLPAKTAKPAAAVRIERPQSAPPPAAPSAPPSVVAPTPPPDVAVGPSPVVAAAPPPAVAEAPPAVTAAPVPAQPRRPPANRKNSGAHKPSRLPAKANKPPAQAQSPLPARAETKTTPTVPAPVKAAIADEPAPTSAYASTKAAVGPTALVMFAVSPWGEVVVDGKMVGVAPPLSELELAPGRYRIEIRNGSFKPYLQTFELEPNQTIRIKYKFKDG